MNPAEQQRQPNMAPLSVKMVHVLARWIYLDLPLNVFATTFGMAANMLLERVKRGANSRFASKANSFSTLQR